MLNVVLMQGSIKEKLYAGSIGLVQHSALIRALYMLMIFGSFMSFTAAQSYQYSAAYNALWGLCSVYNTVVGIIFILALVLVVVGGALFAGSNMLPAQTKGQIQSYGMSIVIGGVVGIVIYLIAPFILQVLGAGTQQISTCNGWTAYNNGGPTVAP